MQYIAPNLSAMVGSSIAAKLMGIAGGLTALSKLPATTIQVLNFMATKAFVVLLPNFSFFS